MVEVTKTSPRAMKAICLPSGDSAKSVTECLRHLVSEHVRFYRQHAAVLRTVYLYMRLRGELSLEDVDAQRRLSVGPGVDVAAARSLGAPLVDLDNITSLEF